MTISFVVLHYLAMTDTMECVESILSNNGCMDCSVVIVDNASPDGSGRELLKRYNGHQRVKVLLSEQNLGFSSGNNIGIRYARETLNSDFVVVLNNDTYLIQDDFCSVIMDEYQQSHFAVLGPQVFDPEGKNYSSPLATDFSQLTLASYRGVAHQWRNRYWKTVLHLENFHPFAKRTGSQVYKATERSPITERMTGVELHGCCLIFSPEYFHYYNGFEELTFMYGEETILRLNCEKHNILMVYNPELKIFHKEAVSTKKEYTSRKKEVLHYKRMWQAAEAIYKKVKAR